MGNGNAANYSETQENKYPSLCQMCGQQFAGPIPCRQMLAKVQSGRLHGGCYHYVPAYVEPMPAMSGIIDAESVQARAGLFREPCAAGRWQANDRC